MSSITLPVSRIAPKCYFVYLTYKGVSLLLHEPWKVLSYTRDKAHLHQRTILMIGARKQQTRSQMLFGGTIPHGARERDVDGCSGGVAGKSEGIMRKEARVRWERRGVMFVSTISRIVRLVPSHRCFYGSTLWCEE